MEGNEVGKIAKIKEKNEKKKYKNKNELRLMLYNYHPPVQTSLKINPPAKALIHINAITPGRGIPTGSLM